MALSFSPIRPLLQTGTRLWTRLFSYAGLGMGVLLLLCSVQMYVNIQSIVTKTNIRQNGFDFIPITKTITSEIMRHPGQVFFTPQQIEEVRSQPFVDAAAPLIANRFRAEMTAGRILDFKTDFFLESIDNDFLDTLPPSFNWEEGQANVPIIFSSDFLEIYNVTFAPSQGLPQISKEIALGIPVLIRCSGNGLEETFVGKIAAFSDRINSILVPKKFLEWANQTFGEQETDEASRLFIKTKDANDPELLRFLNQKNYSINKDRTILGRNKSLIQNILGGLGIFGLFIVILALMLFSFYLQLVIARSRDNLQLLITLGYSPGWLSKNVSKQLLPVYIIVVLAAVALTEVLQWVFYHFVLHDKPGLSPLIHWSLGLIALALISLSFITNYRLVRKLLYRLN